MRTFIKLMMVAVFAMILAKIIIVSGNEQNYSIGANGIIETRCIGGYQYTIGSDGRAVQTLSEFGKGVQCAK